MAGTTRTEPSPELRGDLAVHGFWTKGQTAIFDVRITDTDQPSNRKTAPSKVLLRHEKEKRTNMERFVLHVAAPSLPWCFQWMVSLAKKPKLPLNA